MSTIATSSPSSDELLARLEKRTRRLFISIVILVVLIFGGGGTGLFFFNRRANALEKAQKDLAFSQFTDEMNQFRDFVQPTVNTIQFLRHGYSISFNKVEYTQNGLLLSGEVGNPTHLWISSLALSFSAQPSPYKVRDKWEKENAPGESGPWILWSDDWNIGTAQTTVGQLNPGSTAFFEVTIPNVKQTSDSIEIAVSFSGERYQYLGR
jgi:hypothetical protein